MEYPPASWLLAVYLACGQEDVLEIGAAALKAAADCLNREGRVSIIGPADAAVAKVNDQYRKLFYLKCQDQEQLLTLKEGLEHWIPEAECLQEIKIQFDMNPVNGY